MSSTDSPVENPADDRWMESLREVPSSLPELPPELAADLRALPASSPRRPHRQFGIAVAVSLAYAAVILTVYELRPDLGFLPRLWIALVALSWAAGFAVPLYVALVPRRGEVMPRWRLGGGLAAVSSVFFIASGGLFPRQVSQSEVAGLAHADQCLSLGLLTALVPVMLGAVLIRGAIPVGTRWAGAALGAAGGGLGGLVLHFHCAISDGLHVAVAHGGVVVCAALLTAAVAPKTLIPRSLPSSRDRR